MSSKKGPRERTEWTGVSSSPLTDSDNDDLSDDELFTGREYTNTNLSTGPSEPVRKSQGRGRGFPRGRVGEQSRRGRHSVDSDAVSRTSSNVSDEMTRARTNVSRGPSEPVRKSRGWGRGSRYSDQSRRGRHSLNSDAVSISSSNVSDEMTNARTGTTGKYRGNRGRGGRGQMPNRGQGRGRGRAQGWKNEDKSTEWKGGTPSVATTLQNDRSTSVASCSSIEMNGTDARQLDNDVLLQTLLQEFNGRAHLQDLQKTLTMYKKSDFNRLFRYTNCNRMFLVFENKELYNKSVLVVYHSKLKLCVQYNSERGCKQARCPYIHLCREFLVGSCSRGTSCKYSHDIASDQNGSNFKKAKLDEYNPRERLMFVRNSNLKVCAEYNSEMGCENRAPGACPDVHICAQSIQGNCAGCSYNHDIFACKKTLQNYIADIYKVDASFLPKMVIVTPAITQLSPTTSNGTSSQSRGTWVDIECPVVENKIDEKEVFQTLLQVFYGKAVLGPFLEHFSSGTFMSLEIGAIVKWFKKQKHMKIFVHKDDPKCSIVIAFMKSLRLCLDRNCANESCSFLHVCRDFIFGGCTRTKCSRGHRFWSTHNNDNILSQSGLRPDYYDDSAIKNVLYYSRIKSCQEYSKQNKCDEFTIGVCPDLHICSKFIQSKCMTPDSACKQGHNLTAEICKKTLQQYELDKLPPEKIVRMVFVQKDAEIKPAPEPMQIHIHEHEAYICESHVRKECCEGSNCPNHHCPQPYLWQMKHMGQWFDLLNQEVEAQYCNVYVSSMDITCDVILSTATVELDFETFRWRSSDGAFQSDLRRLTTKSYVQDKNSGHFTTAWLWNWQDDVALWREYGEDGSPPFQDVLEASFASKLKVYCFEHNGQKYEIQLNKDNLLQTNVKTQTERVIRRRPIHVEDLDVLLQMPPRKPVRYYNASQLPKHWHPMDTKTPEAYEKIPLSNVGQEYTDVAEAFRTSMPHFKIKRMYKIQNLTHWNNYERKKTNQSTLYNRKKSELEEKKLFHGTDAETIECICRQNFDPRMHGKNACMFGKGAYFARDAKYSHAYTGGGGEAKTRSMFYARVLPGSKTLGNSSMQRPPPVDPTKPAGELYGSCVNDVHLPTIFVIFERDQCYPEYLIEYKDDPPPPPAPKPRVIPMPAPSRPTAASTSDLRSSTQTYGSHTRSSLHSTTGINSGSSGTYSYVHPSGSGSSAAHRTTNTSNLGSASLNRGSNSSSTSPTPAFRRPPSPPPKKKTGCIVQ